MNGARDELQHTQLVTNPSLDEGHSMKDRKSSRRFRRTDENGIAQAKLVGEENLTREIVSRLQLLHERATLAHEVVLIVSVEATERDWRSFGGSGVNGDRDSQKSGDKAEG